MKKANSSAARRQVQVKASNKQSPQRPPQQMLSNNENDGELHSVYSGWSLEEAALLRQRVREREVTL